MVKIKFLGSSTSPKIEAEEILEGKSNFFTGSDPKKWHINIPTFRSIVCREVYPGIDIRFYGNGQTLEYDVVVQPLADITQVRVAFEGSDGIRISEEGNLEIPLKAGEILQRKPLVYQTVNGKRQTIATSYGIEKQGIVAKGTCRLLPRCIL